MSFFIKLIITVCLILIISFIGKKLPSLAGLIAVMPLTGFIAMLWIYDDSKGNLSVLSKYVKGALFGIIPSILFFLCLWVCLKRNIPFSLAIALSFTSWFAAGVVHQLILK